MISAMLIRGCVMLEQLAVSPRSAKISTPRCLVRQDRDFD